MHETSSAPMSFLRRGSGWETRIAAAREGRRYVPRGGPVKDYTKEEEAPALARRRRAAAAKRLSRSPSKPVAGKAVPTAGGTTQQAARSFNKAPAARAPTAAAQPKQQTAASGKGRGQFAPGSSGRVRAQEEPAAEVQSLREFEALECQVLAEVGHARLRPNAPSPPLKQPGSRAAGTGIRGARDVAPEEHPKHELGVADGGERHGKRASLCSGSDSGQAGEAEDEEEEELSAESSFVRDLRLPLLDQRQPADSSHACQYDQLAALQAGAGQCQATHQPSRRQQHPRQQQQQQVWQACNSLPAMQGTEAEAVEDLQQAVVGLHEERARAARLRLELEQATAQLDQERDAFQRQKGEEAARFEAQRLEELRKLQRDRRVLEKQSRALLKMPTKQSKEEVAAVEALLAEERRCGRAREARHKLAVERLRQQLMELEAKNGELREQVQCLEQQLVTQEWGHKDVSNGVAPAAATTTAPSQASSAAALAEAVVTDAAAAHTQAAAGSASATRQRVAAHTLAAQGPPVASSPPVTALAPAAAAAGNASHCVHQQEKPTQQEGWKQGSHAAEAAAERSDGAGYGAGDTQLSACEPQPAQELLQQGAADHFSSTWSANTCIPASSAGGEMTGRPVATAAQASSRLSPALQHIDGFNAMHRQPVEDVPGSPDDLRRIGHSLLAAAAGGQRSPAAAATSPLGTSLMQGIPPSSAAGDRVVSEVQHADGRTERTHASGLLEVHFANDSTQRSLPSGVKLTHFSNGDLKRVLPCGTVEYLYAQVDSWQVTHPTGVEVFFFPSGQVEAHHPGGIKEVLFADGLVRKMLPDGRELAMSAAHLSREIQLPPPVGG